MPYPVLGILGGGQLGSMLASSAKKLNVKTVIFSDDKSSPAKNFCDDFILGNYDDKEKINYFVDCVDLVTFEFENIPYDTLNKINQIKPVIPNPKINKVVQNRIHEKNLINKLNINTTQYTSVNKKDDIIIFIESKKNKIFKRLKKRKNYSSKLINKFKKIQLPVEIKKRKSKFTVRNNFSNKFYKKDINFILEKIL